MTKSLDVNNQTPILYHVVLEGYINCTSYVGVAVNVANVLTLNMFDINIVFNITVNFKELLSLNAGIKSY